MKPLCDLFEPLHDAGTRARDKVVVEDDDTTVLDGGELVEPGRLLRAFGSLIDPLVAK